MRYTLFICLLLTTLCLSAQTKQNSPYSRYGIGDLLPQYFISQAGMGGQTAAFHDPYHLNLVNPASYASLRSTALETGLYGKYSHYTSNSSSLDRWSGNLAYLSLGFTLKSPINEVLDKDKSPKRFGMGFSLTPYSLLGYDIAVQDSLAGIGQVENTFLGNGGTYKLTWSSAMRYKNTSFGVNLGWLFGKAKYETQAYFAETLSAPTFRDNVRQDLGLNGFLWNLGVQHDFVLEYVEKEKENPKRLITVGLTAESNHKVRITEDKLFLRSRGRLPNGLYRSPDTLVFDKEVKKNLTLPATFSVGVQYVTPKLKLGGQIGLETWSNYENEARPEQLHNTVSTSVGVEYTPDVFSYNRYLKRVRYRAGAYFRQDPRTVNGQDFNDLGVTFGFGFPVIMPRQQTSFVNAAFELGKLGAGSTVSESYARITLGFTLNDNTWFYKRRFE